MPEPLSPAARLTHLRRAASRRMRETLHRRGLLHAAAYIMEFPKSGGSWVARMTTDLVALDAGRRGATPGPVLRDHWRYAPALRPTIYVVRDGRDVAVSLYFYHQRELTFGGMRAALADGYLLEILGDGYDLADSKANLPAFIDSLKARPFGGLLRRSGNRRLLGWPEHIADWIGYAEKPPSWPAAPAGPSPNAGGRTQDEGSEGHGGGVSTHPPELGEGSARAARRGRGREREPAPGVLILRYEDLLEDTARELGQISAHLGLDTSPTDHATLAERHSFQATSGRRPGQEDRVAHQRKGIAGDWKNHFTRAAAEAFADYGGRALVALGYEPDDGWMRSMPRDGVSGG